MCLKISGGGLCICWFFSGFFLYLVHICYSNITRIPFLVVESRSIEELHGYDHFIWLDLDIYRVLLINEDEKCFVSIYMHGRDTIGMQSANISLNWEMWGMWRKATLHKLNQEMHECRNQCNTKTLPGKHARIIENG